VDLPAAEQPAIWTAFIAAHRRPRAAGGATRLRPPAPFPAPAGRDQMKGVPPLPM
jgi:hypothetical protein